MEKERLSLTDKSKRIFQDVLPELDLGNRRKFQITRYGIRISESNSDKTLTHIHFPLYYRDFSLIINLSRLNTETNFLNRLNSIEFINIDEEMS